ncbi:enoyl-CoA hydratase/isomerase family protein [Patulibacter sp. NPDC049589]|uniref:enoyl-CoA hydratase/isomerase family protein n=1 Tax=Patulibacter sp. NPDC049589 TaxID=3154731 RepID=UPI003425EF4A
MDHLRLHNYADRYSHVHLTRDDGVLTVRLHTDDGPLHWGGVPHEELGWCFADIAADPENEVVVITGTGESFCAHFYAGEATSRPAAEWDRVHAEGKRLLLNLLDIPVPTIAAVNGPATVHAEIAVLCDVVLASDDCVFQDAPHYPSGIVPGDGVHVVWPMLLGPNRGRSFLLTGESLGAREAQALGVVKEVLPRTELMPRALELARSIAARPPLTRRYAREVLTQPIKRRLLDELSHGLALEGLAGGDSWPAGHRVSPPA